MIRKVFESIFSNKLIWKTNIVRIFYKSSKTCGTRTNGDRYLETGSTMQSGKASNVVKGSSIEIHGR